MNEILSKRELAEKVTEYAIYSPIVAKHAKPGQFIILRVDEDGERIPFTICDMDKEKGIITILVQAVGYSTHQLHELEVGDSVHDFVGPLGNATDLSHFNNILLVGGGIGTAVIYPQSKYLKSIGKSSDVIIGGRNKSFIFYEDEFKNNSDNVYIMTDDGSYGDKGLVTHKIKELIDNGNKYDCIMAVGPMVMMNAVCKLTKEYNIHTVVSMNCVMLDGTGMCGGCRLTVGGEAKYACVDGPEFDGHLINWAEAMNRLGYYKKQEADHMCRLNEVKI